MNPTKTRLERKLNLIKILALKNHLSFEELEKYMGCTREELRRELSQLFMAGTYPFTPADYIEVDCNGEFVSLTMPTKIDEVIGLTVYEWLALRSAIEKILQKKIGSEEERILKQILEKIQKIIPSDIYYNFSNLRNLIFKAINQNKQVEFYYTSREGTSFELRKVDPWLIFDEKNSYLIGYCHTHGGARVFRLENIKELRIVNSEIQNHPDEKQIQIKINAFHEFQKSVKNSSLEIELLIEPEAYYNFSSSMELEVLEKEYNYNNKFFIKAKTKLMHESWFLDRIKAYGTSVIILKPIELRRQVYLEIQKRLEEIEFA